MATPQSRRAHRPTVAVLAALLLAALVRVADAQPNVNATNTTLATRACLPPHDTYDFCDTARTIDDRVSDLITRLWATSNASIPELLTARNSGRSAVPALGLPEYDWGLNCVHGVQSSCVAMSDGRLLCPVSFPNPVNYGATWNRSMHREVGRIVGTEARALWVLGAQEEGHRGTHIGLDCWSPNINIARDPRWGRNQEVCSEEPLINGDCGSQYTQGLQAGGGDPRHSQVIVTLKHWDAYSLEDSDGFTRHNFNAVVSPYALASTYWPAFRQSVVEGKAKGVMCSYNAVLGVPTCASPFLTRVLRNEWNFTGYVTSDTGALEDIYSQHHYRTNALNAVPAALRDGQCDVCSGGVYTSSLLPALAAGLVTRADIDLALTHTLRLRFELGLFDPPDAVANPYWLVPPEVINSTEHQAANLLHAQASMVLLKNDRATLPFAPGGRIAIIGPHANATTALTGNYLGQVRGWRVRCAPREHGATRLQCFASTSLTPPADPHIRHRRCAPTTSLTASCRRSSRCCG